MKLNTPRWWYERDSSHARVTRTLSEEQVAALPSRDRP